MKNWQCFIGILAVLATSNSKAVTGEYVLYKIKDGDTLSEILGNLGICPLWGNNKMIHKTAKLNPDSVKNNSNFILPKTQIKLPVKTLAQNDDYQISENNEVFFTVPRPEFKCGKGYQEQHKNKIEIRKIAQENLEEVPPLVVDELQRTTTVSPAQSYGILRATTDFFYSAIDSVDTTTKDKAQILSRLNNAYQLAWEQQWDTKNNSFLFYRSEKHSYESVESKLPGKSFNLQGFGLGYDRKITDRLNLRAAFRLQEKLFIRATSITTLKMERAVIPEVTIGPTYLLYSKGPFDISGDLGLSYLLASQTSNFSIKSGHKYLTGIAVTQKIKDFHLIGRSYYSMEQQDSSIMTKKTKDLGISFGVAWSFGNEK